MTVTITAYWLTFLIGVALPAVTALVAKQNASPTVKAVVLLFLSVVAGWLTSLQATGGEFELKAATVGVAVAFITAVASHFGLLKPTGITGASGAIASAVPGGVGSEAGTPTPVSDATYTDTSSGYPGDPDVALLKSRNQRDGDGSAL